MITPRSERARGRDEGVALPFVLAALVLSGLLSATLIGRVVTVRGDLAARDVTWRRWLALDGALRAAIAVGSCAPSTWSIDGFEVMVSCDGAPWETYRAIADGTSVRAMVQRDTDGAVQSVDWSAW